MILIPYNTDAPIYYRPFGTIGLILANIAVYVLTICRPEAFDSWALFYGEGLTPVAWVTSNFVHADLWHLVGNMVFLWGFGLIVEGKVGWFRFLVIYLLIGAGECFTEQLLFLNGEGASFGASAIIFGLMVISLLWAPKNELSMIYQFLVWAGSVDLSVVLYSGLMLAYSAVIVCLTWDIGSELLHLFGAAIGLAIGLVMLRRNWVDCEGWDLLSIMAGKPPGTRQVQPVVRAKSRRKVKPISAEVSVPKLAPGARFSELLRAGKSRAALAELTQIRHLLPQWNPSEDELFTLARGLRKLREWTGAVQIYRELLQRKPGLSPARLDAAEILAVVLKRPAAARKLLVGCRAEDLNQKQVDRLGEVEKRIQFLLDSGVIELEAN
ncbi:rhomboid family intramembrane serine protease [Planctomicrobium sp. SH664]|uniref:rhomboid family intramembrane serine protease n=1 Tax=Planctomicrobium sp. SH664 TaxID=3448125 RepID=UPI003F5BCAB2